MYRRFESFRKRSKSNFSTIFCKKDCAIKFFWVEFYQLVFKPNVDRSEIKFIAIGSGMP